MEELQHVLSELPIEDIAIALRPSNGDCGRVVGAALQRETAALPPETLLRSLRNDSAPYNKQPLSQQNRSTWGSSNDGASHQTKGCRSHRGAMAAHSSPFATMQIPPLKLSFRDAGGRGAEASGHLRASERCNESSRASIGQAKGMLPRFIEFEAESHAGGAKGLYSTPSEPGEPPAPVSFCMASRTEAMVQALSQKEKDRLLRQFLSPPRKLSGRRRRGEAAAGASNNGYDLRLEESEVLDVQAGLWRSIQDKGESAVRDDFDDEAIKLGIRASRREHRQLRRQRREEKAFEEESVRFLVEASKREFREMCRRNEEEEIECSARIEKAKVESLRSSDSRSPFFLRRESGNSTSSP